MPETVTLFINEEQVQVHKGTTIAVAILTQGNSCRRSVHGFLRGPVCGMGVCFECRATVNGRPHLRTCQLLCESGMRVKTDE
jgi:D-hydroxyproline dehydrogenase subunit gamma